MALQELERAQEEDQQQQDSKLINPSNITHRIETIQNEVNRNETNETKRNQINANQTKLILLLLVWITTRECEMQNRQFVAQEFFIK